MAFFPGGTGRAARRGPRERFGLAVRAGPPAKGLGGGDVSRVLVISFNYEKKPTNPTFMAFLGYLGINIECVAYNIEYLTYNI